MSFVGLNTLGTLNLNWVVIFSPNLSTELSWNKIDNIPKEKLSNQTEGQRKINNCSVLELKVFFNIPKLTIRPK